MSLLIIGVVLSFVAAISWGINAHIVRKGMIDENPFYALFLRSLFTAPILFLIVFIWKGLNGILVYLEPEIIIYVLISAMLIIIGDSIFMYTLKHYPVNLIQPIVSVYPLFTTFMLIISKTEEIKPTIILGTIIIILGVITITGGDISGTYSHKALMLGLTAAACWGISVYLVKLILLDGRTDAMGVTGIRILIIGIFGLIVFYSSKNARIERSKRSNISKHNSLKFMALSGIIGWVIGASAFFIAIQMIGAAIPTPISSTNPIIASIIGILFKYEEVSKKQFLGIVCVVIGTITIIM